MTLIDQIKEKIDIVEFISEYIRLVPAGKNYKALCPFHSEKTPSFMVSREKQIWHCFGCGKGGDVIKFLMEYEHIGFQEALKILAEKAGIEYTRYSTLDQKKIDLLYDLNSKAKDFFKQNLNSEVLNYLKTRGLNSKTIQEFELGFAPAGDNLTIHLMNLGYSADEIVSAGLAKIKPKTTDFFQNRIIFPIYNQFGKIVGFSGRSLKEKQQPKYLNSPETLIFNKSKILYGFHKSKAEIRKTENAFLVEGQMDFLMCWQAGIKNAVATSGTALTNIQLNLLKRTGVNKIIVCFDKDEAGINALEKYLENLAKMDFEILALDLGKFKDPAEAILSEPDFFKKSQPKPVFRVLFDFYIKPEQSWEIRKKNVLHLLSLIKQLSSQLEQYHIIQQLSLKTKIKESILLDELERIKTSPALSSNLVSKEKIPRIDLICQDLFSLAFSNKQFLPSLEEHQEFLPPKWQEILHGNNNQEINLLELRGDYKFQNIDQIEMEKLFQELINQLKIEFYKNQGEKLKSKIELAQQNGNLNELNKLLKEFQATYQKINLIKKEL